MLKTYLQKLINLTAKKGADGGFPNYAAQVYGDGNQSPFNYTAPSNGLFVIIPRVQRSVSCVVRIKAIDNNVVLMGRFATDEAENTKTYTNSFPMNKGDVVTFEIVSGTLVSFEWRFFPAKL